MENPGKLDDKETLTRKRSFQESIFVFDSAKSYESYFDLTWSKKMMIFCSPLKVKIMNDFIEYKVN